MLTTEQTRILDEAEPTLARFESCEGPHNFVPFDLYEPVFDRERCTKCGAEVDATCAHFYREGLAHGVLFRSEIEGDKRF